MAIDGVQCQFNYRAHHAQAAQAHARSPSSSPSPPKSQVLPDALRLREKPSGEEQEPERWAQYVPEHAESLAAELREARRVAREEEDAKLRADRQRQMEEEKREREAKNPVQRKLQDIKTATKQTAKKAKKKVKRVLDNNDDEEEDDDDEGENDTTYRSGSRKRSKGKFTNYIWASIRWIYFTSYMATKWSGRNLLWLPLRYLGNAVRWSASTSWRTTRWTGERALVGPALTVGAPLIYLGQGLLFIFVFIPVRVIAVLVKELYPL
jgi:hypothetical protein